MVIKQQDQVLRRLHFGGLRDSAFQGPCLTLGNLHQSTSPSVLGYFKESLSSWGNIVSFEDSRGKRLKGKQKEGREVSGVEGASHTRNRAARSPLSLD